MFFQTIYMTLFYEQEIRLAMMFGYWRSSQYLLRSAKEKKSYTFAMKTKWVKDSSFLGVNVPLNAKKAS